MKLTGLKTTYDNDLVVHSIGDRIYFSVNDKVFLSENDIKVMIKLINKFELNVDNDVIKY